MPAAGKHELPKAGKIGQVRTCVGCRKTDQRSKLLRIVVRDGVFTPDDRAVLSGRGAWIHETQQCMSTAVTRGAISRALRVSPKTDTSLLENRLKMIMDHS